MRWFDNARLVAENKRLRDDCESLLTALALANDTVDQARMDLRRVARERDEALAIGVGLRCDLIGHERLVRVLMETAPSTIEELDRG